MIFKKIIKSFFAAVIGIGLILPPFAFAAPAPDPTSGGGGGVLSFTPSSWGSLVPIDLPLGTLRDVANKIAWHIAKLLVHRLTQNIVNLIRTGGQGGTPLFVQDWSGFLLDAADQASGIFLKELKLTKLCEPFGPRLRVIFGSGRRGMERFNCTVSAVAGNFQAFFDDFNNGGWQRWIELTQVQNNPYGSYLGLLEEKEKREAIEVRAKLNEAIAGSGFLGIEECGVEDAPEEGGEEFTVTKCKIVNPGKYLENRLAEVTTSDIRQLELADSFNEILIAAFQSLINGIFFAPSGLSGYNINSTTIQNQLQQDLDNLKKSGLQFSGIDSAILTTQAIIDKKNNSVAKIKDQIQTLQALKTCQKNKLLPTNTVENDIKAASSTKQALEQSILSQELSLVLLQEDRKDLLAAQTVEEFNAMLQKTRDDASKAGSLAVAVAENDQIAADKTKAEEDLQNCLKPPSNE